jgi:hypothetical protein
MSWRRLTKSDTSINSPLSLEWVSDYAILTHFNICRKTLEAWHEKEGLPKYQIGRLTLYKASELNELIEKHRKVAGNNRVKKNK